MVIYHGTDLETAKKILKEKELKGDYPLFGPGVCTTIDRAKNFAAIKCQKYLSKGRDYTRKQIAVLELEIDDKYKEDFYPENVSDAFTIEKTESIPIIKGQILDIFNERKIVYFDDFKKQLNV